MSESGDAAALRKLRAVVKTLHELSTMEARDAAHEQEIISEITKLINYAITL